jgi:hypothetical protein
MDNTPTQPLEIPHTHLRGVDCVGVLRVQLASQLTRTSRGFNLIAAAVCVLTGSSLRGAKRRSKSRNRQAPRVPLDRVASLAITVTGAI